MVAFKLTRFCIVLCSPYNVVYLLFLTARVRSQSWCSYGHEKFQGSIQCLQGATSDAYH